MTEKNANAKIRLLTLAGAMTALTVIFTAYIFHIPVGINGGYVHFGDTVIYLAAVLLPAPYAMMVGALGGGIADFLTAPMWAIATVIIKMLIVIPFTSKGDSLLTKRNLAAPIISFFISATGYFIAEKIIFGGEVAFLSTLSGSVVQSGGSAIFFYIGAAAFQSAGVKRNILKFTT